ncbi:hypothetical protein CkaCkLH20_12775 [Colletotrichum karsti]|uniref:F-box domain-containing protein n=1 Tax=Colletotrichum karsti TaxID=1095194 RepID=A0A9P6LEY3_9PEZI|nr:uncharacterized protein CkaCkLH20_12775 [Colletotrichum karsti]KAF9869732.1 hypothetical protein CkaCkLH20_12775 [Colletotrichum karsti]
MERIPPVVDRNVAVEPHQQPLGINSPFTRLKNDLLSRSGIRLPRDVDHALRFRGFMRDFGRHPRFNDREDETAYHSIRDGEEVSSRLSAAESPSITEKPLRKTLLGVGIPDTDVTTLPVRRRTRPLRLSRIEKLTYELLLEVLDHLELHEEYVLSCTSWIMRQTVRGLRKMESWGGRVSHLSRQERLRFLTGIATFVPDKWACKACCKLHQVDESDFPLVENDPVHRPRSNDRDQYPCPFGPPSSIVIASHEFHYVHVQMALKLNRMGMTDHPYYEKLMRVNECSALRIRRTHAHRRLGSHSMIPKIVDGRFLFQTKVILDFEATTCRFEELDTLWLQDTMCACISRTLYRDFQRDGGGRLEPGTNETMLYCTNCRTECSTVVKDTGFEITFWYDLGAYGSPDDFPWTMDPSTLDMRLRNDGAMSAAPGSIRDLWEQDED